MSLNLIPAPKIDPLALWNMPAEQFNAWRRQNDFPRIIQFLKNKLVDFQVWMDDYEIKDDDLLQHSPAVFLTDDESFSNHRWSQLPNHLKNSKPYPIWFFERTRIRSPRPTVDSWAGRSAKILSQLELLDLGNCGITNLWPLGDRNLDFTNLSDLRITHCMNNRYAYIWFSFAANITCEGDLPFIDAYETSFYDRFPMKIRTLKLYNGSFQSWSLKDCDINLFANNAVIHRWVVIGSDFDATISNTDVKDCIFDAGPIRAPIHLGLARNFHAHIKILYSQLGKKKEASRHYFLEKTFERKGLLHPRANFSDDFYKKLHIGYWRWVIKAIFIGKYLYSGALNLLWGYGERPARVFGVSLAVILLFAIVFFFIPGNVPGTYNNFSESLYYSMLTFSTMGYGDISKGSELAKILTSLEALSGISFWGILIAGFTNSAKDY